MNKFFILAVLSLLASTSNAAVVTAPAVTVTAPAVTVNAGSAPAASQAPVADQAPTSNPPETAKTFDKAPASSSSSSSTSSSGDSGSGSLNISQETFIKAFNNAKPLLADPNAKEPTAEQYKAFISKAGPRGGITSNTELAMFFAEVLWESVGLTAVSETACKVNNCAGSYDNGQGIPGKYYYGRGYIQLSWNYNYADASKDLYGDDRLLQNPDQVATDDGIAWDVSFWFWKSRVKPKLNGTNQFGLATRAINGGLECDGAAHVDTAKKRFQIYTAILKVFEPSATPIETGCYS